ncbi:MAG: L-alanine exporter AlaE [Candidatus Pacearchaeota archaeon]
MSKEANISTKRSLGSRAAIADVVGNNLYGLIVGGAIDYASGLDTEGVAASRLSGAIVNTVTGALYGWWREKICQITRTDESSGRIRKSAVDFLAFNTFQTPLYAMLSAIGSKVSEGSINWDKAEHGAAYLIAFSPFIAPTMGWFMDGVRRVARVKSAAEGSYGKTE